MPIILFHLFFYISLTCIKRGTIPSLRAGRKEETWLKNFPEAIPCLTDSRFDDSAEIAESKA